MFSIPKNMDTQIQLMRLAAAKDEDRAKARAVIQKLVWDARLGATLYALWHKEMMEMEGFIWD